MRSKVENLVGRGRERRGVGPGTRPIPSRNHWFVREWLIDALAQYVDEAVGR